MVGLRYVALVSDSKESKIVSARLRLKERFEAKLAQTPARSDESPQGTGPINRHGMPQLPPGQHQAKGWPVLDLGRKPEIGKSDWRLELGGACERPQVLEWTDFAELTLIDDVSDFHCVTTWSRFDVPWQGVRFSELAALAGVRNSAHFVLCHGHDGYTTNVPLVEAMKADVLIATHADGAPLSREHGGPARMITPQLYAWKGTKWISKIEFLEKDQLGYWEERGYSNTAHPWREDRYS